MLSQMALFYLAVFEFCLVKRKINENCVVDLTTHCLCSNLCCTGNSVPSNKVKVMPRADFSNRMGFDSLLFKYACEISFCVCTEYQNDTTFISNRVVPMI